MVVLNRIYTRSGDGGTTALSDGSRVPKDDPRVEAYGTVDEANAALGIARHHAEAEAKRRRIRPESSAQDAAEEALENGGSPFDIAAAIARIQNELFDLGADLSRPLAEGEDDAAHPPLRIVAVQTERLEREIDRMNAGLAPLGSFVLPGGSLLAAHLHMARTVTRRAERAAFALARREAVNPEALRYLNRLSDWLFVAARHANGRGSRDILWQPGATRPGA